MERRAAEHSNPVEGKRTPLSGMNSGHETSSDSIRMNGLYQEVKHRKSFSVLSLHKATKKQAAKERKIPISIIHQEGMKGLVYLIHSLDLDDAIITLVVNRNIRIFADRCPQCECAAFTEAPPQETPTYLRRSCAKCGTPIPYAKRSIDQEKQTSLFPFANTLPAN